MKRSLWNGLIAVVAVLGVVAGFPGHMVQGALAQDYDQGTAPLVRLDDTTTIGTAVFERTLQDAILTVQVDGARDVAGTTLDIIITTTPQLLEVQAGTIQIDGQGNGTETIKEEIGEFPMIQDGSMITLRTQLTPGLFFVRNVARGTFHTP